MKALWLTDIHLNFLKPKEVSKFFDQLAQQQPDALLIGGDIAHSATVGRLLEQLADRLECPIYFVLGNHDFWESSIPAMRRRMIELSENHEQLHYLGQGEVIPLSETTALIGHDGWYDGRCGDYERSRVCMNDFVRMGDFAYMGKAARLEKIMSLGDEAADYFRELLPRALEQFSEIILLTHVPPFREAAWHQGEISDDNWLPFMSCRALGEVLVELMAAAPDKKLRVLCGHTHGGGELEVLANLQVKTGAARYGQPEIQEPIAIGP